MSMAHKGQTMDGSKLHNKEMDLNALRIFAAVADAASFSAAAQRLGIPKWSVSRSVSSLEASIGVPLLHRTTRLVKLSPAGATLRARVAPLLLSLDKAARELPEWSGEPAGEVRISAPIDLGSTFLADALTNFKARYPSVNIEVFLTGRVLDYSMGGFDIALREWPARMKDSSIVVRRVCPIVGHLFASPAYLASNGTPRLPSDLANHEWVTYRDFHSLQMESPDGPVTFKPRGRLCSDDVFFVREAVRSGAGIGSLPTFLVEKDIAKGHLVLVLPQYRTRPSYVYIVRPDTKEVPRRVQLLSDFLFEYLSTNMQ